MRLSLCSTGNKDEALESIIPRAARIGYDGIEIWQGHLDACLDADGGVERLSGLLRDSGLQASVIAASTAFIAEEERLPQALDQAKQLCGCARKLGGAHVRLFLDWIGSAEATEAQWIRAAQGLKAICRTAEQNGVFIIMETHHGQLTDTTPATLRLLELVDSPQLKVNLDIYNLFHMGENPLQALQALWPHTVNIHLKNGRHSPEGKVRYGYPLREGDMDFMPFLRQIRQLEYGGFAAIEWFGDSYWDAAESELRWLKETERAWSNPGFG
ncbi:sugar phosphate isomerase/epimerase [Paenibacillus sp. YN15]|uniref:sugar phosphate isomerase/epimerase family protein n=1 Tax=Paenibacillus sp. YN15 TaxID=1742774 RepID=UPI000DCD542C|nr:sugar phosphate isomerase/epimerase family protein [Paenibacillus sp. YN15]RAU93706.1 hypothetical protein DQG13_25290 [Paenibacillus sp. YN15]